MSLFVFARNLLALIPLLAAASSTVTAQPSSGEPGPAGLRLEGTVLAEHSRRPIAGARVELPDLRRVARTDARGRFVLESLRAGSHAVVVSAPGYRTETRSVSLPGGTVEFALDVEFHAEPVLVTASPEPKDALQVYQPTTILGSHELEQRSSGSLGMTLQNEPGISTTNLGTAPARPVIRGLGGDRVLILEDGVRVGDASSLSPDHAVAVNPDEAERIEIVRGPANLLYGSNAMGGVINVLNGEIPTKRLDRPAGTVSVLGASNTDELAGQANLSASAGPVAFRGGWSRSDAGEFDFPRGTAGHSQFDTTSFHGGVSWVGGAGYLGAAYRDYDADYGIPVDEDGNLVGSGDPGVTIRLEQRSFKAAGQISRPFGGFSGARVQAVRRDYTHTEFEEDGSPGTIFNNDTLEARGDVTHRPLGPWKGSFGLWFLGGKFQAIGDEAILPRADTRAYAGFLYCIALTERRLRRRSFSRCLRRAGAKPRLGCGRSPR